MHARSGGGFAHLEHDDIALYTTDNTMLAHFINVSEMACAAHRDTLERLLKADMARARRPHRINMVYKREGREERLLIV